MSVHRELIHGIFIQIFQNSSVICLSDQLVSGLLCLCLTLMLAGAADTAPAQTMPSTKSSGRRPTFMRRSAFLHSAPPLQRSTFASKFSSLSLHALYNSRRYASAVSKTLSEYRAFLILVRCGLQLYTLWRTSWRGSRQRS